MRIEIRDLTFEAILGILEHERRTPQRIVVDITIDYHYSDKNFVDYAKVCETVEQYIKSQRFELIEDALESTIKLIKDRFGNVSNVYMRISKPDILPNAVVSVSVKK